MLTTILTHYGLTPSQYTIQPFGSGLINHTWKISTPEGKPCYILQQINTAVFKHPLAIAMNIHNLGDYLQQHYPDYLFAGALPTTTGGFLYEQEENQSFGHYPWWQDQRDH